MFLPALKISTLVLVMAFALPVFANEAPEGEGPKKEEKKEEWVGIQARVQTLEMKIKSSQDEINKLIEEKAKIKDPQKSKEIIEQMKALHKEMQANVKEYDQQRALLKYRYPEKDFKGTREYERIEVKSLDEMENQMSLSSSVTRTLQKVRTHYEKADDKKVREETAAKQAESQPKKAPSLVDPVIMKK